MKSDKYYFNRTEVEIINIESIFVSPIYAFSLAADTIVYTPSQGINREMYCNQTIYKKTPSPAGNKHHSIHFSIDKPIPFQVSTKKYGPNP